MTPLSAVKKKQLYKKFTGDESREKKRKFREMNIVLKNK